jgi:hypothetical protein
MGPCDGGPPDATPEAGACDASTAVSFDTQIRPLLSTCGGEFCHAVWTYDSLVGKIATECCDGRMLVAPGDPDHSYLLDKLRGHGMCRGSRMPAGGVPLAPDQIQTISDWICEGAPNH